MRLRSKRCGGHAVATPWRRCLWVQMSATRPEALGAQAHFRRLEALYRSAPVNRQFESEISISRPGVCAIRFEVDDLVTGHRWEWGDANYVRLDAFTRSAHIMHVVRGSDA